MESLQTFRISLLEQHENAKNIEGNIQSLEVEFSETVKQIKITRRHLCNQITNALSTVGDEKLSTLENLINGKVDQKKLKNKFLDSDFLFLYLDSTYRLRIIHPLQFTAYKINDRIAWQKGIDRTYEIYEEEALTEFLVETVSSTKNWMTQFKMADLINRLVGASVPIAHAFMFLDNTRKVHHTMKADRVQVFMLSKTHDQWSQLYEARDKLIEVNNYLDNQSIDEEAK